PAERARRRESAWPSTNLRRSCCPPPALQASAHLANGLPRLVQGAVPVGLDLKKPFRSSSPLGGRFAGERSDIAFRLEPFERGIHGTNRDIASGALFDLAGYGHAICVRSKPYQGKKDDVFKRAEQVAPCHVICFII